MALPPNSFLPAVTTWLETEPAVQSAVLFGSSARREKDQSPADARADVDLHVVTTAPDRLMSIDWSRALPDQRFCLQVVRPATGGVRKVTVLFAAGEIDLVLVPAGQMRLAKLGMSCGLHHRMPRLRTALDEMATCLRTGYRFLKGEKTWGTFYARVEKEMPGVRLDDRAVCNLADIFLCNLLWLGQKLERGELAAAQLMLHAQLAETNFRLLRELRLRQGLPQPSFGLARRVEALLTPNELAKVQVDARLEREQLRHAAAHSLEGLVTLTRDLVPGWQVPVGVAELLAPYFTGRG